MNKSELVAAMAEKSELSKKDAEKALKAFMETVNEEVKKGEKVQLIGFGTFQRKDTPEKTGINPLTKESITISAKQKLTFKSKIDYAK